MTPTYHISDRIPVLAELAEKIAESLNSILGEVEVPESMIRKTLIVSEFIQFLEEVFEVPPSHS